MEAKRPKIDLSGNVGAQKQEPQNQNVKIEESASHNVETIANEVSKTDPRDEIQSAGSESR